MPIGTSNMREREYKFKVDENTPRIAGMFQFANAFATRMIDLVADISGMPETERTELFQVYLDGMMQVNKAFIKRDGEIST